MCEVRTMSELDDKYLEELKKLQKTQVDGVIPSDMIAFLQSLVDQVNKNWEDVQKLLKQKKEE
jgi:DNA-binding ferritin-like protein (Dps family)